MRYFKKTIEFFLFLCLVLVCVTTGDAKDFSPDIQRILDRDLLRVCMKSTDSPPFFMRNSEGHLEGLDIQLAKDMARHFGVKIVFDQRAKNEKEVLDRVEQGLCDLGLGGLSVTATRALSISFSDSYAPLRHVYVVSKQDFFKAKKNIKQWVQGKRIGVIQYSAAEDYIVHAVPAAHVVRYDRWSDLMTHLEQKKIDVICVSQVGFSKARSSSLRAIACRYESPIGFALSWRDRMLLQWVNIYIDFQKRNGTLKDYLHNHWIRTHS